jgi:hypothetical protein
VKQAKLNIKLTVDSARKRFCCPPLVTLKVPKHDILKPVLIYLPK